MFNVGDKVIYTSGSYGAFLNNPLWSVYRTKGTVVSVLTPDTYSTYRVHWDNDTDNTYEEDDLELYNSILKLISEHYE